MQEAPDLTPAGTDLKDLKPVDSDEPVVETKAKIATDPVQAVQPASAPAASAGLIAAG